MSIADKGGMADYIEAKNKLADDRESPVNKPI